MEAEAANANPQLGLGSRLELALLPALLVSIGYVDPGKWAATIEGGARFGFDLVAMMLMFNLAAILCQYVAARISVATGRDLAQICTEEYDRFTCMFLGVQAELSAITLDLTMVLGVAHALNLLLGVDLSAGVFLAALDAALFPVFCAFVENHRAHTMSICTSGLVFVLYFWGVLLSQPEISFSMNGIITRLSGDSAFTLLSLLGANIMPHNFYLHSHYAVKQTRPLHISRSVLFQDQLFAILCIFSGIYVVNYVLMTAAANVFHSTGLVLITFQDAMSIMEQVFRSPVMPLAFLILMFFSSQITALAWATGGEVVLHGFLKLDIPSWLHRATIRILAVTPAFYSVWTSGPEGIYQLLIFTQVIVALTLPSSVIPLFRIATSRQIMSGHKIPQPAEFLALLTFMAILGLDIVFVVEMIFGSSNWVGNLRWTAGNTMSVPYVTLLISACSSFCFMLWLAATPLKSASNRLGAQAWTWDPKENDLVPDFSVPKSETEVHESRQFEDDVFQIGEPIPLVGSAATAQSDMCSRLEHELPETILMSDQEIRSISILENKPASKPPSSEANPTDELGARERSGTESAMFGEVVSDDSVEKKWAKIEGTIPVEKTVNNEGEKGSEKDDDDGEIWEPEELPKTAPSSISFSAVSDGPPSFRSLSGKSEEGGSGTGSLSRLAGLGRAARRHLAAILDEFWGQLYDFHGQVLPSAKEKKFDLLFGVDSRKASSATLDSNIKESGGRYPFSGNSSLYESPLGQPSVQGPMDSLYGVQRGHSQMMSSQIRLLNAYVNSNRNAYDSGERRYSSLRVPPSFESLDNQPNTMHGYCLASYLNQLAKERTSDPLYGQADLLGPRSPSLGSMSYHNPMAFVAVGSKSRNGFIPEQAAGFQSLAASRTGPLQSERNYFDPGSLGAIDSIGGPSTTRKYHSLPDISGRSVVNRALCMSNKSPQWDTFNNGSAIGQVNNLPSMYSGSGLRAGAPLPFDELSPSRGQRDAILPPTSNPGTGSLWSRQPFEQFGVAERSDFEGPGSNTSNPLTQGVSVSTVDPEAQLLQSFRNCIVKLLKLEGSEWLFKQNDGADEDLIDSVAAREKFIYDAETREINKRAHAGEPLVFSVPNCGDDCIWRADLIVSFGVWCIHRILDLSLMESRPELWGKYTYVLNRLQGVIEPAFSRPRAPPQHCFCLQIPAARQSHASPPVSNGMLPPAAKPPQGRCTTPSTLLDLIKDVEIAISCRRGRSGTAAGDVAFPKGKENLASVLKRYKRRLSNRPVGGGGHEGSTPRRNHSGSIPYGGL